MMQALAAETHTQATTQRSEEPWKFMPHTTSSRSIFPNFRSGMSLLSCVLSCAVLWSVWCTANSPCGAQLGRSRKLMIAFVGWRILFGHALLVWGYWLESDRVVQGAGKLRMGWNQVPRLGNSVVITCRRTLDWVPVWWWDSITMSTCPGRRNLCGDGSDFLSEPKRL
jgi:hypothetical protein